MKIAQIAPLAESVPPKLYGGTERVVSYLTEELVRQGHDVTLFASGDSITSATLVPCCERALRLDDNVLDALPHHILMLDQLLRRSHEFDVVHFHIDLFQFPFLPGMKAPSLTTLHGRQDLPDLQPFYRQFGEANLVSISNDQRRPLPPVKWVDTIYHGIPEQLLSFNPEPRDGGYLAFLGRISPEKRPDRAIEIATKLKHKIKIAAKVDKADAKYWANVIEPMVRDNPYVEFIGEIGDHQKSEFLGNAKALLFPIDWPEPFGMVMIEAMACGTPVLAFRCGSVPEVIEHGVSGWIVDTMDEALSVLGAPELLDRATVRKAYETRYTARRMAEDYVRLYQRLIDDQKGGLARATGSSVNVAPAVTLAGGVLPEVAAPVTAADPIGAAIRQVDGATEALRQLA